MTGRPPRVLVVGLGSADRGDDAVGPTVVAEVARRIAADPIDAAPRLVTHEDPTALVDLIRDRPLVVVVDAVRTGAEPGTVTVLRAGADDPPLPASLSPGIAGTHGLGLPSALALARAMDLLPEAVLVVGVEAAGFDHGAPLSSPVRRAVPEAVDVVLAAIHEPRRTGRPTLPGVVAGLEPTAAVLGPLRHPRGPIGGWPHVP